LKHLNAALYLIVGLIFADLEVCGKASYVFELAIRIIP